PYVLAPLIGLPSAPELIQAAPSFRKGPVHGVQFPGLSHDDVPYMDVDDGYLLFLAIDYFHGRVGSQFQEFLDRTVGVAVGPGLKQLAQKHQGQDDGRCLKIDMYRPVHGLELIWEEIREKQTEKTEDPGHSGTDSDQGEHIGVPSDQTPPGPFKEHPSGIKDHWNGQHKIGRAHV